MTFYVVYCKGKDWENIEAFLDEAGAQDYLKAELLEPGVQGQIKTLNWNEL